MPHVTNDERVAATVRGSFADTHMEGHEIANERCISVSSSQDTLIMDTEQRRTGGDSAGRAVAPRL